MYPYLKTKSSHTMFTTAEDLRSLDDGEKIIFSAQEIPVELLKRILLDDEYFALTTKLFAGEIESFYLCSIQSGTMRDRREYHKLPIFEGLQQLIETKKMQLSEKENERFEFLKNALDYSRFVREQSPNLYKISIDRLNYLIPSLSLIRFMEKTPRDFADICRDTTNKSIDGFIKEHFIYAAYHFFEDNRVLENYFVSPQVKENLSTIAKGNLIDIQAINEHLDTEDELFREAKLSKELETHILSGLPSEVSDLEKALYIYIKMCRTLTYDEKYFASASAMAIRNHRMISHINEITPNNNEVVCFEFNMIYTIFLDSLGIRFHSDYEDSFDENYGYAHVSLDFRCGKFLVNADSVTSVLQGDLPRAKRNEPLVGITCKNTSEKTQSEFKTALLNMYKLILVQENDKTSSLRVPHVESFEDILSQYINLTANIRPIEISEKMDIFISELAKTRLKGVDLFSKVEQLKKVLFDEYEREHNLRTSLVRIYEKELKTLTSATVIAYNEVDFDCSDLPTTYYLVSADGSITPIAKRQLKTKIKDGTYEYIKEDAQPIPGIRKGEGNYDDDIRKIATA